MNCDAAIDAPGGFLFEWWSVFWDIFIARTNEKHSEVAAAYLEVAWDFLIYNAPLLFLISLIVNLCSIGDIGTTDKSKRAPAADADAAFANDAAKTCSITAN